MRFPAKITSSRIWVAIPVDWVILHWYACGADGRSLRRAVGRCTVTWLPNFTRMGRLLHFLTHGAPLLQIENCVTWLFEKVLNQWKIWNREPPKLRGTKTNSIGASEGEVLKDATIPCQSFGDMRKWRTQTRRSIYRVFKKFVPIFSSVKFHWLLKVQFLKLKYVIYYSFNIVYLKY